MVKKEEIKKVQVVEVSGVSGVSVIAPELVKTYPIKTIEIRFWCDNVSGCGKDGKPTIFAPKDFATWPYIPHVWRCGKCGSSGRMGCFEVTTSLVDGNEKKTEWKLWGCGVWILGLCIALSSIF